MKAVNGVPNQEVPWLIHTFSSVALEGQFVPLLLAFMLFLFLDFFLMLTEDLFFKLHSCLREFFTQSLGVTPVIDHIVCSEW